MHSLVAVYVPDSETEPRRYVEKELELFRKVEPYFDWVELESGRWDTGLMDLDKASAMRSATMIVCGFVKHYEWWDGHGKEFVTASLDTVGRELRALGITTGRVWFLDAHH